MDLAVRDGNADHATDTANQVSLAHDAKSGMDGSFGDAIHVDDFWFGIAATCEPWLETLSLKGFAGTDDVTKGEIEWLFCGGFGPDQLSESRWGLAQDGDFFSREKLVELERRAADKIRNDHQASAIKKGTPHFKNGDVESVG